MPVRKMTSRIQEKYVPLTTPATHTDRVQVIIFYLTKKVLKSESMAINFIQGHKNVSLKFSILNDFIMPPPNI